MKLMNESKDLKLIRETTQREGATIFQSYKDPAFLKKMQALMKAMAMKKQPQPRM